MSDGSAIRHRNTVAIRDGIRGNPNKIYINESGLFALIFGSSKPRARRFKRWVSSCNAAWYLARPVSSISSLASMRPLVFLGVHANQAENDHENHQPNQ